MFANQVDSTVQRFGGLRTNLWDAIRGLRAGRGSVALAFVILTLTMTAGTVIFSVVDAIAIRPLPYGSPERLVSVSLPTTTPGRGMPVSPQAYFDWRENTRAFELLGAARFSPPLQFDVNGVVESVTARRITASLFDVLAVRPAIGRFFSAEHESPGGPKSVILSHELWVRRFRADPEVLEREMKLDGELHRVVGVLPRDVAYPISLSAQPDVYLPYEVTSAERSNNRGTSLFVVGRLRPHVTIEQARADVAGALLLPLHDQVVGPAKTWLLLVLAAVGFVLLVACVNVASLLLARATTRACELATREALGASRRQLAAGLLLEGLILSLASALASVVLSLWGVEIAKSLLPPGLTRVSDIAVDGRVLSASIAAAVVCGLVFASAPAWLTARSDLVTLMKTGGGSLIGGRRHNRSLSAFLVADVAFVSILLVATTLVVTSFMLITTADLGFDRQNVMSIWFQRSLNGVAKADRPATVATFRAELLDRARSVPGVTQAAILTSGTPMSGTRTGGRLTIPGAGTTTADGLLETRTVTPDYFGVMGMQLIRGRLFESSDRFGAPQVLLINDVAARRFFPDRDPIGQAVSLEGPATIVGLLKGVRSDGPELEVRPEVYQLLDQQPYRDIDVPQLGGLITVGGLVVRTNRDARGLAPAVREAIEPAASRLPNPTRFVDDDFRRLTAVRRLNAGLMTTFGLIAVAIAAIGVYGTTAFTVAQQTRATGLRMALGASPSRVLQSVLRAALQRVGLGAGLGLAGAWTGSNTFTSFVFGIRPTEPVVYLAVAGFLAAVAVLAALVPGLRAARLDPLTALETTSHSTHKTQT